MPQRSPSRKPRPISTDEFDRKFDAGEDITEHLDFTKARLCPPLRDLSPQKVNVDFPAWVVAALDHEANRLGVPRQCLIKVWIVERLERPTAAA